MSLLDVLEYNGQMANYNREVTIADISDVTFKLVSGTDTNTVKFLDKGSDGHGFILRPDKEVQILSIKDGANNEKLKGDPLTVSGNTAFVRVLKQPWFVEIVLRITQTTTNVKLLVL